MAIANRRLSGENLISRILPEIDRGARCSLAVAVSQSLILLSPCTVARLVPSGLIAMAFTPLEFEKVTDSFPVAASHPQAPAMPAAVTISFPSGLQIASSILRPHFRPG